MPVSRHVGVLRDRRIDVLRGFALLAVFIDHIPGNALHLVTLQSHALADAAEIFVFLAGYSAWLAYGRALEREGALAGLCRVLRRCGRVYLAQIVVLVATSLIVSAWLHFAAVNPGPYIPAGAGAFAQALILYAQPAYVEILPLYVCLLLAFPLLWIGLRRFPLTTVVTSGCLWLLVNLNPCINLPESLSGRGWTFNPFEWQFLFTLGAAAAASNSIWKHPLQRTPRVTAVCWIFLIETWLLMHYVCLSLPSLSDSHVAGPTNTIPHLLRLLSGLSILYLALTSAGLARLATSGRLLAIEVCGKHSLAVFGLGTVLSLVGRLTFRTAGDGMLTQALVNGIGIFVLIAAADMLERRRHATRVHLRVALQPPPAALAS